MPTVSNMATAVTISSKGQITLPKELRERHHLLEGERVIILDSPDGILIRHARTSLRGSLRGKLDGDKLERELRRLRKEWSL
jgi:AbrB family looped-hinge helix DNA binding protein